MNSEHLQLLMNRQEDPRRKTGHSSEDVSKKMQLESTLNSKRLELIGTCWPQSPASSIITQMKKLDPEG